MQKLFLNFKTIIFWEIVAIFIFVPLFMKFPLFYVNKTFVSIRLEDVLILIAFISWVWYLVITKRLITLIKSNLALIFIAFFIINGFSVISAVILTQTTSVSLGALHFMRRFEVMFLMLMVYTAITDLKAKKKIVSVVFITSLIVDLYAIGQRWLGFPAVSTTNAELSKGKVYFLGHADRVSSTFAGHYDLAIFLMMIICIAVPLIIYYLKRRKMLTSCILGIILVLSFGILVLTAARLSFIAVFIGIISSLFLIGRKRYLFIIFLLLAFLIAYPSQLRNRIVATVRINVLQEFNRFDAVTQEQENRSKLNIPTLPAGGDRVDTSGNYSPDIVPGEPTSMVDLAVYRSFSIRTNIEWPRALRAFYKNPLYGTGYSSLGLATDNDFLRSLGETGIFGTIVFLSLIFFLFKKLYFRFKNSVRYDKYLLAGIISMYLAYLTNALFIDVFEASKTATIFWLLIGLGLSAAKVNENKKGGLIK